MRDRSTGWQHAKLSGHENEAIIVDMLQNDPQFQQELLNRIGLFDEKIINVETGGIRETNVTSILGHTTKSKTDIHIILQSGKHINISLKKSLGGQVYLIPIHNFIDGYEKQFGKTIPNDIKEAIALFWGSSDNTEKAIDQYGTNQIYEKRKHRLVAGSLKNYNSVYYDGLLQWVKDNIGDIVDFCFARGLAKDSIEWATHVWYKNEVGENDIDEIFSINDIKTACKKVSSKGTFYGTVGGGTTIQLPFGFVQWHSPSKKIPGDMQFHHNYEKIHNIIK